MSAAEEPARWARYPWGFPCLGLGAGALGLAAWAGTRLGWFGSGTALAIQWGAVAALLAGVRWQWRDRWRRLDARHARSRNALEGACALLVAADEKSRALLEGSASGIALFDDRGVIRESNRRWEELFGIGREAMLGMSLFDLLAQGDRSYLEARLLKLVAGEPLLSAEWEITHPERGSLMVESHPARVEVMGEPLFLVALNDVTERNRLRREVALNEKLATVGTLAAGIVHEINNPTAAVMGNLQLIHEVLGGRRGTAAPASAAAMAQLRHFTDKALDGTYRIAEIVAAIKGFARIDPGQPVPLRIEDVVESALAISGHKVRQKATVSKEYAPGLPAVQGSAGRLQQLFVNLLVNAAEAMEGGGAPNRITIRIRPEAERLRVDVEDTGAGIPPAILARIFDPFFTTKPPGIGSGLGLSISHEIVRQHGGNLEVASQVGQGTRFTLTLPALAGPMPAPPAAGPVFTGSKVLVVDDDPAILAGLEGTLAASFHVVAASGGREAMAILDREDLHAVVADLDMPDINGIDLYHHVTKAHPGLQERMVFVAAGGTTAETQAFLRERNLPCLPGPYAAGDLERILLGFGTGA